MICYNGEQVWPEDGGYPGLYSIGVALGRIPRFCGHTKEWYPVLGHVLTVAQILPPEASLAGLLHDAPEACMSDVPTPWKTQAARRREDMLLHRIYKGNGLVWPIPHKIQELVDWADHVALTAEAHVLGHPAADIFGEPDAEVSKMVAGFLDLSHNFLRAEVAGPIYEEAFSHYLKVFNEYHDSRREARNAKRREQRAKRKSDATGEGVASAAI